VRTAGLRRLWISLGVGATLAASSLSGCAYTRPGDPELYPVRPGRAAVTLYLVNNGYHTNLAIPRERIVGRAGPSAEALELLPPQPWVMAGYGDAVFYRERGAGLKRFGSALRAMFAPNNASLINLEMLEDEPPRLFAARHIAPVTLSEPGLEKLLEEMDRSFKLDDGRVVDAGPGVERPADSRFFEASLSFSIKRICNHWIGNLLGEAGVPIRPVAATHPRGLMRDVTREQPPADARP
jgi:hypothetical protein